MRTRCDAYHKGFECHNRSILDMSEYFEEYMGCITLLQPSNGVVLYLLVITVFLKFYIEFQGSYYY